MKKAFGLALILILLLMLSVSCGISQDKYDKVVSELSAAQVQIQKLQGDLNVKTTELSAKEAQLKATNDKLTKAKNEVEVLNNIMIPSLTGEYNNKTETELLNLFFGWRDKVNAIGDASLNAKFQALIDTKGSDVATMAFLQYLFEDIARTLK